MRRAVVVLGRQGGLELPGQKWQICPGAAIVMPVVGGQRGGVWALWGGHGLMERMWANRSHDAALGAWRLGEIRMSR